MDFLRLECAFREENDQNLPCTWKAMKGLDEKSLRHTSSIEATARVDGCSLLLHGKVAAVHWG